MALIVKKSYQRKHRVEPLLMPQPTPQLSLRKPRDSLMNLDLQALKSSTRFEDAGHRIPIRVNIKKKKIAT